MNAEKIRSEYYLFHGLSVRIESNSAAVLTPISRQLEHFRQPVSAATEDISFTLMDHCHRSPDLSEVPSAARCLYRPSKLDKFDISRLGLKHLELYLDDSSGEYWLQLGDLGMIRYHLNTGKAKGFLRRPETLHPAVISGSIFSIVFNELLKARGYFPIHSAGVAKNRCAVLLPGFSGAGKTTTCLALIRAGYRFITDDKIIIRSRPDRPLEVLSFPETVDVTDQTIDFFPELKKSTALKSGSNLRKKSFSINEIYPEAFQSRAIPHSILFPKIIGGSRSFVEKVPKKDAFGRFLPHSLLVFNKETAQRHFNLLYELVEICQTWTLNIGDDLEQLPEIVDSVLA